ASTAEPRIAVLGCGWWGKNLVRNFHALGVLRRVCDPAPEGRAKAQELAPRADVSADLDQALAPDIDGVVIATPAETHYALAKRALEAGRDVFCEKPLALDYSEAQELVTLAQQRGRMLMVGHVLEYHPAVSALRALVASGDLGGLQYIYSNRLNLGKIRREENILWSFAPHDVAVILRLMDAMPFEVVSCGGAYVQPNIADVTVTQLLFDNGVRAHIFVSWLHPFKEQRLVVIGSKAMATFDDVNKKLTLYDQRVEMRNNEPVAVRAEGKPVAFAGDEPLALECKAFLDALRTRQNPLTDGTSGLRTLKVLQAAQRSLITNGQPVLLDRL
ncbi:MAG: Gfo/Idh/MocA family oxidoreductase, partial [Deltaproteobacteria bacterium]|nr:Gfo/Idh/MocA family oxidoreductase [Deltaproteobacteria bacterium]